MAKPGKKKRLWVLIVVLVIVAVAAALLLLRNRPVEEAGAYTDHTVAVGDVTATITGSGVLAAADSVEVELPAGITVQEVLAEAGDAVKKGDVLATLDPGSLQRRAEALSAELSAMDAQLALKPTTSQLNSPVEGRLKHLPAEAGAGVLDVMAQHGALAIISTDGLMKVELTAAGAELHSEVEVRWGGDSSAQGTVAQKLGDSCVITLSDRHAPYLETASIYSGGRLLGSGVLQINSPVEIMAVGGRVKTVHFKLNALVDPGDKLFTLQDEQALASYSQGLSARADKAGELAEVLQYMAQPQVVAPEAGVVAAVGVESGAETGAVSSAAMGAAPQAAFLLHTGGAVKLVVDVDELDMANVSLGQQATVTLDAYAYEHFAATVTHISRLGKAAGSITTYGVELTLGFDERLLEGMNGSAVIAARSAEDVPLVPVSAIFEDASGSYVNLLVGGQVQRANVTLGVSDGEFAEVTGGLKAGDVVRYNEASGYGFFFPFADMGEVSGGG